MLPEEDHKLHEYPITDIVYGSAGNDDTPIHSSLSSGCEAGFGVIVGLAALCVMKKKKK